VIYCFLIIEDSAGTNVEIGHKHLYWSKSRKCDSLMWINCWILKGSSSITTE